MSPIEKRNIKRILLYFLYPLFFLLRIIPRDKNIWMFGNFKGYIDNPKYLFEYLHNDAHNTIEIYWITRDKELYNELKKSNRKVLYYYSFIGVWKSFRAGVSFLANGYSDVNKLAAINSFIIHFWHGTPIKKIFFDAELVINFHSFGKLNGFLTRLNIKATQLLNNKINIFLVSSYFELERMKQAFRIKKDIFRVVGVPRQDVIEGKANKQLSITNVFDKYNATNGKIIVYAPSWRDKGWVEKQNIKSQQKLNDYLEKENAYFFIKRHPLTPINELLSWGLIETKRVIFIEDNFDINGAYQFIDIIITDFSSVMFDYGLLNKPVLFFITDLDEYSNNRGFYDDIVKMSYNRINKDWDELINSLYKIDNLNKFVNHPHFEYMLNNKFIGIRKNIVELVKKELSYVKN
ncbi:MAG TPA: hypothetical protein EYG89_03625 [Bacteroidia bacterium]|nr:hypothetical protein [Bacteroidia bacterium]